jgi:hypothetical protein
VPHQLFCLRLPTMASPITIPRPENSSPAGMLCNLIQYFNLIWV